jgi:hypothetical protein
MTYEGMNDPGTEMHDVITKMIRDMKIVGLFYVIAGAINCLTIIGAIVGVPYIFAGLRLRESAGEYMGWLNHEPGALFRALEKQQRHFFIMMVMLLVGLVITALCIAVMVALIAAGIFVGLD